MLTDTQGKLPSDFPNFHWLPSSPHLSTEGVGQDGRCLCRSRLGTRAAQTGKQGDEILGRGLPWQTCSRHTADREQERVSINPLK